jgi:hypothetical protein
MRFMILVKGNEESEAATLPSEQDLAAMAEFNEKMVKAGVMLSGEGLQPTSKGAKVRFGGSKPVVIDGPFSEAKEVVAGYWLVEVKSRAEAIEWATQIPFKEGEVEIRQLFELSDFPAGDAIDHHARLKEELDKTKK